MMPPAPTIFRNTVLAALPAAELSLLRPHLIRTSLVNGQPIHEAGERIDQVYFFEHGFASMVAVSDDSGGSVEVGLVGWDSMVGLGVLLNPHAIAFNRTMVQMPGVAYRMSSAALPAVLEQAPILHAILLRGVEVLMAQIAQTAACNSRHALPQRCARWLLLAHDRVEGDELRLTQEFLSMMLAVRRSGVTVALQTLQSEGFIRSGRGRILVCDRAGLEGAACDCYDRVRAFTAAVSLNIPATDGPRAKNGAVASAA